MSEEGYYIDINGLRYPLEEEVFDLIEMISIERDAYKEFLEGKLPPEDLLAMYPDIKLNTKQLNFKES